jgi:hypothetical protein
MTEHQSESTAEVLQRDGGRPLPRTRGGGRSRLVRGVAVLAVLGTVAGAVWAWQSFMEQGPQPAEALPASTLGYVALDFDPAAGQKLSALNFLRKFPSVEEHVGVTDAGDLRKDVFDDLESDLGCGLDYRDVEPWLGQRFAFAFVDHGGPQPVAVLQVADHGQAATGLKRVAACADDAFGYALGEDWVVLAETDQVARDVQREAAESPLADDADFQRWTGEAGEPGVMTLYAAPEAGPAVVAAAEKSPYGVMYLPSFTGLDPMSTLMTVAMFSVPVGYAGDDYATAMSAGPPGEPGAVRGRHRPHMVITQKDMRKLDQMTPAEQDRFFEKRFGSGEIVGAPAAAPEADVMHAPVVAEEDFPEPEFPADLRAALMDFSGLGGVVRFDDGALELELVSDRIEGTMGNLVAGDAGDDVLATLPADSAVAFGAGFRDGWVEPFLHRFAEQSMPFGGEPMADPAEAFEKQTGLTGADLQALGGTSFALVAGAGLDPEAIDVDPASAKVAARISGNADQVEAALSKVDARTSGRSVLHWRRAGNDVLVGANDGYLDELAASGNLTGEASFTHAVPGAAGAASVVYLNFDAGDWFAQSMSKADRPDAEPLAAAGYTLHDEGDRERTVIRLTTED